MSFPTIAGHVARALIEAIGERTSPEDVIPILARNRALLTEASSALNPSCEAILESSEKPGDAGERAYALWREMKCRMTRGTADGTRLAAHYLPRINVLLSSAA